jgi:threonine dehydratase
MPFPTKEDITVAAQRISGLIHRTPVLTSTSINQISGCTMYFKCENFQKVGAFKFRGATNALSLLSKDQIAHGVATHSSGNHAQALALAAKLKGVSAYIVMPENAPKSKKEAVLGYGAEVIECASTVAARESTLESVTKKTGAYFIHPYNDDRIITGQATCAKELIETISEHLDYIIAPVGGGGLLSGTALSATYFSPGTLVIGAEPAGADDAFQSFQRNEIVPSINPKTIADGLLTSLGDKTFPVIKKLVKDILVVEDARIIEAMKLIWQRMKIIVEPSAAVPLAVVLVNRELFANKKIGIILSGGNIDFDKIPF